MTIKKIALVGLSGVGKTTCVKILCPEAKLNVVDMDCGLDVGTPQKMDVGLSWIRSSSATFLAVSNHISMLEEIAVAKSTTAENFSDVLFLYLHVDKTTLVQRLSKLNAHDKPRGDTSGILNDYEKNDRLFRSLQDEIIETSTKTAEEVVSEIKSVLDRRKGTR